MPDSKVGRRKIKCSDVTSTRSTQSSHRHHSSSSNKNSSSSSSSSSNDKQTIPKMKMFRLSRAVIPSVNRLLTAAPTRCRLNARAFFTSTLADKRYAKSQPEHSNATNIIRSPIQDYDIPESPFLPHYLMENWHKFPNKTALINGETGVKTSYGELQTQTVKLGSAMRRLGFDKGDILTIISPNCPEFFLIYLAGTAIGMTVSPINPQYTQESKVVVFSPSLTDMVNACLRNCHTVKKTIVLGNAPGHQSLADLLQDDGKTFPENISYNSKEDILTMPYSSGTSGPPKGVMLTSYSIVANMIQSSNSDILDVQHDGIYLCVLPLFHIFAQTVIMCTGLRYGVTMVTMSKFDPVAYLNHVQKYKATHLHIVTPIMLFLASHPMVDKFDLSSVQECFFGAAPTPSALIDQFQDKFREKISLCQGFGMTELSPGSHTSPKGKRRPKTIGVVLPNTQFKKEPDKRKMIQNGSGDVAYYDEEGYTVITDRLKELIKVKGFQVAPAELEDLLLTHPAVKDVAVIGKPDDVAGELPRAYVVLRPEANATEEDIANYVKEKAVPYKQLKGGVEFRKEIPKSSSGKILKRILRDELQKNS
ncbi:hypothetical protein LSH36_977g02062 [Paralvinella palmiformis]|uniref:4-coumarate--CoA ligase n=1 Tax=Paralvinella palmiformis TaxID=53620 RepID=A0AAD9IWR8_9ANNE|nr:hypothetical protein LSH36_977g02062 [Paralvinella palmiformis]